jgi:glucokinase
MLQSLEQLTAEDVFRAAEFGDVVARSIVRRTSGFLSRAIYGLLLAYDVDLLVLGGGVFSAGDALMQPIFEELTRLRTNSGLAQRILSTERIVLIPKNFNPGIWGALALAVQRLQRSEFQAGPASLGGII